MRNTVHMALRTLFSLLLVALASLGASGESQLCTVAQLKEHLAKEHSVRQSFTLTGLVTYATPKKRSIVLRDVTGPIQLYPTNHTLSVGDEAVVSGVALVSSTSLALWSSVKRIEKIGHTDLKTAPTEIPFSTLEDPASELRYVKTEATVVDVIQDDLDPGNDFIVLRDGTTMLPAFCPHNPDCWDFIDARVEIAGLVQRGISSERKFVGTCLAITGPEAIRTLTPPPADPFDYPPLTLPHACSLGPRDIAKFGKRTARGFVAATWGKRNLLVKTDKGRFIVVNLTNRETLPRNGERVTVVGSPVTDLLRLNLKRARVRVESHGNHDRDEPERLASGRIPLLHDEDGRFFIIKHFGRLVTVRGIVRALPLLQKGDYQILLDCGDAKLPVDFSSTPSAADGLRLNSEVEVTGRYLFQTTEWHPTDVLPRITDLMLVVRKPDDIRVISGPPWWTPGRLSVVIALLFAAVIILHVRGWLRKRYDKMKLKDRTQLAVELHDSLSQSLTGLACQISAAQRDDCLASSKAKLTTADQMLQSCRTELKNCLFDLRNDTLAEKTFDAAIRRTLAPFADQVEISVRFNVSRARFDDAVAHAILAIVRELVANAIRHGHAWTVKVAGTLDKDELLFSVRDDGCGFDPERRKGSDDGHFGLDGICERLENLNGSLEFAPAPSGGTKAIVRIKLTSR